LGRGIEKGFSGYFPRANLKRVHSKEKSAAITKMKNIIIPELWAESIIETDASQSETGDLWQ